MRWINRKAIRATEKEEANNPRARSAQLRVLEKLGEPKGEL
jgi:16S rRNA (cytosine1402-N4)-methyltransferase